MLDEDDSFYAEVDDDLVSEPNPQEPEGDGVSEPEVEPVAFSKKTVGIIVMVLLLLLVVFFCYLRGMSVESRTDSGNSRNGDSTPIASETTSTSSREETAKNSPLDTESFSTGNSSSTKIKSENVTETTEKVESESQKGSDDSKPEPKNDSSNSSSSDTLKGMLEVSIPNLSEPISTTGVVSSKKAYLVDNSYYIYEVSLIIVTGNGESTLGRYYCPRTTFDSIEMGNTLKVEYQVDSEGCLSISSLSR